MKKRIIPWLVVIAMVFSGKMTAQQVNAIPAAFTALKFWNLPVDEARGLTLHSMRYDNGVAAWLVTDENDRFVIISADSSLRPVLAYGDNLKGLDTTRFRQFIRLLASDYSRRLEAIALNLTPSEKHLWQQLPSTPFQQWPPDGSTPTGGWLYTNWTQTSPYNKLCPMDLNAGSRSVVGCPATAMAQIFNYNRSLNFTRFDDSDDYYHSYGSGNQYWIDNDFDSRQFPSFPELNLWLDTLETCYQQGLPVSDSMKAALSFAAGVAARQVYTASVSGTFGIDQAHNAILRFGFDHAELLLPPDTSINRRVTDDMKAALPVQLGLVDAANTVGHNVVVDGYNTDQFYHFNFGWGGSANGWYTLPPTSIPYNLTVIEGVVVQIRSTYAGTKQQLPSRQCPVLYVTNNTLTLRDLNPTSNTLVQVIKTSGELVLEQVLPVNTSFATVELPPMAAGLYLFRVVNQGQSVCSKGIVR